LIGSLSDVLFAVRGPLLQAVTMKSTNGRMNFSGSNVIMVMVWGVAKIAPVTTTVFFRGSSKWHQLVPTISTASPTKDLLRVKATRFKDELASSIIAMRTLAFPWNPNFYCDRVLEITIFDHACIAIGANGTGIKRLELRHFDLVHSLRYTFVFGYGNSEGCIPRCFLPSMS